MYCNYFSDNTKKINELKADFVNSVLIDPNTIPVFTCSSGISVYEPDPEDREQYCTGEFTSCPRLQTIPKVTAARIHKLRSSQKNEK